MKREIYFAVFFALALAVFGYYFFYDEIGLSPSFVITNEPECNDGFDNDGDGKIDFPADLECFAFWDNSESLRGRCEEEWSCTQWSACVSEKQERICRDINECGTVEKMPVVERKCGEFLEEPQDDDEGAVYLTIAVLIILGLIIFLLVNKFIADRDKDKIRKRRQALAERLRRKKEIYVGR